MNSDKGCGNGKEKEENGNERARKNNRHYEECRTQCRARSNHFAAIPRTGEDKQVLSERFRTWARLEGDSSIKELRFFRAKSEEPEESESVSDSSYQSKNA